MKYKFNIKWLSIFVCAALVLTSQIGLFPRTTYADDLAGTQIDEYTFRTIDNSGNVVDIVSFPSKPPDVKMAVAAAPQLEVQGAASILSGVPAFTWCYGCSPTSAAMLCGYYDQPAEGYVNIYTGPANGGVCPLNNETYWGHTYYPNLCGYGAVTCGECPLSATRNGLDGRTTNGHVDDYWQAYFCSDDPYYGSWTPHSDDCLADFMGTSQWEQHHTEDGNTYFIFGTNNTPKIDPADAGQIRDGCHGIKLFLEYKGYTVTENYNQNIYGYGGVSAGFTYNDFKSEIDAGRPVIIQLVSHSMLGYGYSDPDTIYVHDTWDNSNHSMTWGGSYGGYQQRGVTVIHLATSSGDTSQKFVGTNTQCTTSASANWVRYAKFTATVTGPVTEFRLYSNVGGNVKVAIYADNGAGKPGSRVNYLDSPQSVTANQWNTISFPSTSVESGTDYWLAVANDTNGTVVYNSSGGNGYCYQAITFGSFNWPATAEYTYTTASTYNISLAGWGLTAPPELAAQTDAATAVGDGTATLNGALLGLGDDTSAVVQFEYDTDGTYTAPTTVTADQSPMSATGDFSHTLSSLTNGQTYHFRAVATGSPSSDIVYGDDMTFTPGVVPPEPEKFIGTGTQCTTSASANWVRYAKFTATVTGPVTEFRLYSNVGGNVKVAIYADNGAGKPGSRVNYLDSPQSVTANQWNTISFPSTSVESGTDYWLAVANDTNGTVVYDKTGGNGYCYQAITFGSFNWPATAAYSVCNSTYNISLAGWGTVTPPTPPDAPLLLSPGTSITFEWGSSTGATTYWLQVNTTSDFTGTNMFNAAVGDVTYQEVTGLSFDTVYYWRVKAGNAVGWSDWSSIQSVETSTP